MRMATIATAGYFSEANQKEKNEKNEQKEKDKLAKAVGLSQAFVGSFVGVLSESESDP